MRFNRSIAIVIAFSLTAIVRQTPAQAVASTGQTITSNQTGRQGNYTFEYWKDNGTGTMKLGEGGNFSCSWSNVGNILFRKGLRPGIKNQLVKYSAVSYQPDGNSYLAVYGWTRNPLVEYYIVEAWGSWKPPGSMGAKGSVTSDSGTYDIYSIARNGANIDGNGPFTQYWSVRRTKKTSGSVSCLNHFSAWESVGMKLGTLYEVSFDVEGYQSSGSADVTMSMVTGTGVAGGRGDGRFSPVTTPVKRNMPFKVLNPLGREIAEVPESDNRAAGNAILFNAPDRASGVYFRFPVNPGGR